jgi:geranylgeranyl pyrophosphate synthase
MEMVHTYSLIHDDLPAMDDDDLSAAGRPATRRSTRRRRSWPAMRS